MDTLDSFLRRFGNPDGTDPVIDVGTTPEQWPLIVATFADTTVVLQLCGIDVDGGAGRHLSVIIHAFINGDPARAGVYGMDNGRRYPAFDDTAPGTSHGWPAVRNVTVLIGRQQTPRTSPATD